MSNALIIRTADAVSIPEVALQAKENALAKSALVGAVKNVDTQEEAIEALKPVKVLINEMEKHRKLAKQPVLDQARLIDATAEKFVKELKDEELRLNTLIGNYQQEQLAESRRQEAIRQAELQRIEDERREAEYQSRKAAEEEERKRVEAEREANRKANEAAAQARQAAEAAANAKTAAARKKAQEEAAQRQREADEAARLAKIEQDRIESERKAAEEARRLEEQAITERSAQAQEALGGPVVPVMANGQKSAPSLDFEVTDIWKLVRSNPGFVDVKERRADILKAIREFGVKEIPGVRIFEVVKTQVNTRGQKAIDV